MAALSAPPAQRPELADIFRDFDLTQPLRAEERKAVRAILDCRTAALGGRLYECGACGSAAPLYNSCRNRHCPKCQGADQARWEAERQAELLPVPYFHAVFTLPKALHPFFRSRPKIAYKLFFRAVSETLQEVAANPKYLGARIGFTVVLHTWTQKLEYHPHLHCIVPSGGLSEDGTDWIRGREDFFLPVPVLRRVFRGKLLDFLNRALERGELSLPKKNERALLMAAADREEWVVYLKPTFGGPDTALRYLSRYTHRIALSNRRLLSCEDGRVRFLYRDRKDGNSQKVLSLPLEEFQRRFLSHVLPKGLRRIRHFGFLANRRRRESLALCRRLLGVVEEISLEQPLGEEDPEAVAEEPAEKRSCPHCGEAALVLKRELPRQSEAGRKNYEAQAP